MSPRNRIVPPHLFYRSVAALLLLAPGLLVASPVVASESSRGDVAARETVTRQRVRVVQCNHGHDLAAVLERTRSGDVVVVNGTCRGRVVITTDGITLEGNGTAVLDGGGGEPTEFEGVVTVDGSQGVVLSGLSVENGPGEGILLRRGAAAEIVNTDVSGCATGVAVGESSTASIVDSDVTGNGLGLDVFTASSAVLQGTVRFNENLGTGVEINGQSILEIRGADVEVNDNGGSGIGAGNAQIAFFGFTETQVPGSTLTVMRNTIGIALPDSSFEVVGGRFFGSGANVITVSDNEEEGFWLPQGGSLASPFATATFVVENNGVGLSLGQGSAATLIGGLQASGNGVGVLLDAADLTLVSVPPNPSSVTGNDSDVEASFGARLTTGGATVGSLTCDPSVLSRGSTPCP